MTSGAMGAFMLGISQEEFFIEVADNVLVITEPGSTTPLTGNVPEYLQDDIKKVDGVLEISPETLGLAIAQNLNDKSIIVRGITPNFIRFNTTTLIEGSWFDPHYGEANSIQVNGAMIGSLLAEDLGLSCGRTLQLVSTFTDAVVEVVITGIISSDSPSDEEILVSLALGKTIAGKRPSYVSILRVLIDQKTISKESLANIINTEYIVPISLSTFNPKLADKLVGTPIVAYTPYGEPVETKLIEDGNKTEFMLQFGTYEFVATPPETPTSPVLAVFVNQSFHTPFEITIGGYLYDLQLNISLNEEPAKNASILLKNRFKPKDRIFSSTSDNGLVEFFNIPESFYYVNIDYKGLEWQISVRLNQSLWLDLALECSLRLNVLNIFTDQVVHGGTVKISRDLIEVHSESNYQSGTAIYLDRGNYHVEFTYEGILREFTILVNRSVHKTIYVGTASLNIWVRGENGQGLDSTNVSIERYDGVIQHALSNSNGSLEFQLEVGLNYYISAIPEENQSRVFTQLFSFKHASHLNINFLSSYHLNIFVFNGTIINIPNSALPDCSIQVLKGETIIFSGVTNSSGQMTINFTDPGTFKIIAEKDEFLKSTNLIINSKNPNHTIILGNVRLLVSTQSISNYPISGATVALENETGTLSIGTTNSSGLVELFFPIGRDYKLKIWKDDFYHEENISFTISQSTSIVRIIELGGSVSISLTNQFHQKLSQAYIVLANEYYNIEYKGFTNHDGEIVYYEIPWGNYSVQITYYEENFPRRIIDLSGNELKLDIQVEMANPFRDLYDYTYRRSLKGFSVVLSSEYVSGFLQSTLKIFTTTFTSVVIIISVLSILSIASVISHPIVSNTKAIRTFQQLGATRFQVIIGVVAHLSLLGVLASVLGAVLGMVVMTIFPTLRSVNIGGVIINPQIDVWFLLLIVFSNLIVVIIKAGQKTHELYNLL